MTCNVTSTRFHPNHASHVVLEENRSVAYRTNGYHHGIVFSERYLYPGELFVVEIERNDRNWVGYLRLGLTHVDPANCSAEEFRRDLFELKRLGSVWMFELAELFVEATLEWPYVLDGNKIEICDNFIKTCCGRYARIPLSATEKEGNNSENLEVGYRVGVVYIPDDENSAEMYYVFNGNVFGPYAMDIPYKDGPLFAVADLYGRTRKIRVLPLRSERSLKQLCRMTILQTYDMEKVNELHLPESVMDYLNFNAVSSII